MNGYNEKIAIMIELRNITKKFGSFTAVNDLSLNVRSGEFFGFLGPNGAGKTTTIKMMAGLFSPTSGEIIINGFNVVTRHIEAKQTIAYVPDQPFLYDKLTGREFFYFVGGLYKIPKEKLHKKIPDLIAHFEIGDWVDKRTEDYSQGMRQRITIAAALLHDPKTIIIDEPMIGLDPRSAKIVKDTLRKRAQKGASIFMSTHSLPVAEELCDRIGIIKSGRLVFCDTQDKLQVYKKQYDGKFESVFLELTK
ncbi:MAG TPA: ABC transporter ATP-binding protein [Bacteroidota bacterium]|nr:ABC transporter ATP-binding protein [Bacteroidota bacterium]